MRQLFDVGCAEASLEMDVYLCLGQGKQGILVHLSRELK